MNICNKFVTGLFLLFISCSVFARTRISGGMIVGKVVEKNNYSPMPFATVSIENDCKKIIGGTTTGEDGCFEISNVIYGKLNVKISFIGFKDTTFIVEIQENANKIDLGVIELTSDAIALKSAIVTAKIPVIEQKLDKIVMNVSAAVTTQGSNALDIIKKAPGVSVDPSGNILLNGNLVSVWLDGHPSNLTGDDLVSMLNSTDGSAIDKIEIIAQPSSKYDASGTGGIINIKTRKNFIKGISGSIRGSYSAAYYNKYYPGSDGTFVLNYKNNKSNSTLTYSPRINSDFRTFDTETIFYNDNFISSDTRLERTSCSHNIKLATDFYVHKKNIFGYSVSGTTNGLNDYTTDNSGSTLYNNNHFVEKTKTSSKNDYSINNFSLNFNYTRIISDSKELNISGDYYYYDLAHGLNQENTFLGENNEETHAPNIFISNSNQFINIMSFKTDYEQSLGKVGKLETGIKWAKSYTDNILIREEMINSTWIINNNLSSKFNYNEDITAAYFALSGQINKKIIYKAGLRGEYTTSKGEWISIDSLTSKKYIDIFPTIFTGYNPNENIKFSFSYSIRTRRPSYGELNPSRFYLDAKTISIGNPELNPEYSHNINLTLGVKKAYTLGIRGTFVRKAIIENPDYDSESEEKTMTWQNFGKQNIVGGFFSITELAISKWFVINGNIFASYLSTSDAQTIFKRSNFFAHANISGTIILPKNYKIELSGRYQSRMPYGYFVIDPRSDITIGLRKEILKSNFILTITANDLLSTNSSKVTMNDNIYKYYLLSSESRSRRIVLSLSYRFGQGKKINNRKYESSEEVSRVGNINL
ncbi:MAG: NB-Dependent Receptor [Bacteroidetes bacterium]|nr:NB-Dependent Receptor [Bacteroidota bacterium]